MVGDFYEYAQDRWAEKKLVQKTEFEIGGFNPILEVGLAVEKEDGIYAKGGADRFSWLQERVEAGKIGGKKSAQARKIKYGTAQPHAEANPKQSFDILEAAPKQTEAPPKPTVTSLFINSPSDEKNNTPILDTHGVVDAAPKARRKKSSNPIALEIALKNRAAAIADQLLGTLVKKIQPADAGLTEFAIGVINTRFGDWERFNKEAAWSYQSGKELFFISQLKESVLAALLLANDQRSKNDL